MKKKILILLTSILLLFPLCLTLGVNAKTNEDLSLTLEQQESSDYEKVRYILTLENVDNLSTITKIEANLFLYKYGSNAKKTTYEITKVYEYVSGENGKDRVDNTYYAVLTLTNVKTYFDGYTLTCQLDVTVDSTKVIQSNPISYTINENFDNSKIISMDASAVPSLESAGVKYYDFAGNEEDVFRVLADNGFNYIRVRVWNDPYYTDEDGNKFGYGGGNCDIENCLEIGRRANKYGMKLLVDFQYSDFWTDPEKQKLPKAWANYTDSQIEAAIYNFTTDSLTYLKNNGIEVGMVQVGNETNDTLCGHWGDDTMEAICGFFNAGSAAVRNVYPNALVALHFANPSKSSTYVWYAQQLKTYNVDYDVFGSSYYPYWHGTMENMTSVLSNIAKTYNKKIMILETAYANTDMEGSESRSDGYGNTVYTKDYVETANGSNADLEYPFTVEGQKNQMLELFETVFTEVYNGIGASYWEGTWISVNKSTSTNAATKAEENKPYWEQYGCGWRTTYATTYDSETYPNSETGGCVIENEAFFDETGHPYDSLKAFKTIRDTEYVRETSSFSNDIENGDFSTWDLTGWTENSKVADTYEVAWNDPDNNDTTPTFHYWSNGAINIDFSQDVSGNSGSFTFSIQIRGGSTPEAYVYVLVNGVEATSSNAVFESWDTFETLSVTYNCKSTDIVVVGVHLESTSGGAWGNLKAAELTQN